jgi:hypothetical protein
VKQNGKIGKGHDQKSQRSYNESILKWFNHRVWWYTPAIPVLKRQRKKDHKFKVKLGYLVRTCLKNKTIKKIVNK